MIGAGLMIVNQAMGLVLPASTKYLIDVVIAQNRTDLLWKIALAAGGATIVQGNTDVAVADFDYSAAFPWFTDGIPDTYLAAAEWAHDPEPVGLLVIGLGVLIVRKLRSPSTSES